MPKQCPKCGNKSEGGWFIFEPILWYGMRWHMAHQCIRFHDLYQQRADAPHLHYYCKRCSYDFIPKEQLNVSNS